MIKIVIAVFMKHINIPRAAVRSYDRGATFISYDMGTCIYFHCTDTKMSPREIFTDEPQVTWKTVVNTR